MKKYIREILELLGNEQKYIPWFVVLILCLSVLDLAGLGLIGPYVTLVISPEKITEGNIQGYIEYLNLPKDQKSLLIMLGLILLGIFLFKAVFAILINRSIIVFSNKQQVKMKSFLMHSYQQMPYEIFLERNSAEYILALNSFTASYAGVLTLGLKIISDGLVAITILVMLALVNFQILTILVFFLGSMVFGYDRICKNRISFYGKKANEARTKLLKGINEGIEGLKELRILGKEKYFHEMVTDSAKDDAKNQIKQQLLTTAPKYLMEFLLVSFVVFLVFGALFSGKDLQTLIPTLSLFAVASLRLMPIANSFSISLSQLRFHRHSISKLYADTKLINKINFRKKINSVQSKPNINFKNFALRNISFTYQNIKLPTLNKLTLEINCGESIGLVGTSGSGKTTLLDVFLGLLNPQEGLLLYNGKPLNKSLDEWRSQIAYLPQQVFIIDDSLRSNVALGIEVSEINDLKVENALRQARLMELVEQLPQGVNTLLGERGIRLSGGQRQRIAIARAFYHERSILVLDESTSALDNNTEKEIVNEIKYLKGMKTMIVIAHRLTTLQHCDRIYELKDGQFTKSGTYEEFNIEHKIA